jgi:YHS domain-containing protein
MNVMHKFILASAFGMVTLVGGFHTVYSSPAAAASATAKIALNGIDLVSYFKGDGKPVTGNSAYVVLHNGAIYHFASQQNADAFKADPDAFLPQYGGHCAWAVAEGSIAPGDPDHYHVVAGKLYLNYNAEVQSRWVADIPGFIAKADANWLALRANTH